MAKLGIGGERYATLGDPNAPITVVEFADFGCPACRTYETLTFPGVREQYIDTGKIFYVYKDLPIVSQHGDLAAQAAECAGEQDQYWAMHRRLFLDPQEWDASEQAASDAFQRYASDIGIDSGALSACVASGRYADEVRADFDEAQALHLIGTPMFFIDGALLAGAQSSELFADVLDERLPR